MALGDSERFEATGIFKDGSREDLTSVVQWSSSHPSMVAVDQTGKAVAKQSGTADITAMIGAIAASAKLTIPPAAIVSITIVPPSSSVGKGQAIQLTASGTFTDGSTKDISTSVTWVSSTPGVAAVSATGLVTGIAAGTSSITATSGSVRGAENFTVTPAVMTSLVIGSSSSSITKGKTLQLTVTGTLADGSTQDMSASVTWSSSAPNIISVSASGVITAIAVGTATISAHSGSLVGSAVFTVSAATLTSIALTPSAPSITKGKTQQLAVTGTFSDGSTQDVTATAAWTVSSTSTISVNNAGLVTAVANGTATVTATVGSVSGSDAITVTSPTLASIAVTPASPSIPKGKRNNSPPLGLIATAPRRTLQVR